MNSEELLPRWFKQRYLKQTQPHRAFLSSHHSNLSKAISLMLSLRSHTALSHSVLPFLRTDLVLGLEIKTPAPSVSCWCLICSPASLFLLCQIEWNIFPKAIIANRVGQTDTYKCIFFWEELNLEMKKKKRLQCNQMNPIHRKIQTRKLNFIPTQCGFWI